MKVTIFRSIFIVFLLIPQLVFAQAPALSPQELAVLISQLQAKIVQLQAQIAQIRATGGGGDGISSMSDALAGLSRTLSRGMEGEDVRRLQEYLARYPDIYPEGIISGYFGALTEAAVRRLQKTRGLEQVGTVGPRTREIINREIVSGGGGTAPTGQASTPVAPTVGQTSSATGNTSTSTTPATPTSPPPPLTSDGKGPWITALSVSPVSTSPGGQVTFTVSAEDPDGIGNVIYDIRYPSPSSAYVLRPNCNFNGAKTGTCSFTQAIDIGISPVVTGAYVIESVRATDLANVTATYYPNKTVANVKQSTHNLTIPSIGPVPEFQTQNL